MNKYKKKPVVIEAIVWGGEMTMGINLWMGDQSAHLGHNKTLLINTLEGTMTASVGDYIIKGVKGEFYPCKPDIFEETYEEVKE